MKKKHKTLSKWPFIFMLPYFAFYFMFFIYPTILFICNQPYNWDSISGAQIEILLELRTYKLVTKDKLFYKALGNTFMFMIIYIPLLIIGGLVLAVLLYKLKKSSRLFQRDIKCTAIYYNTCCDWCDFFILI